MRSIRTTTEPRRVALALAAAIAALGCDSIRPPLGARRDVPPQRGGTLRTAFFTNVRTLDAATAFDTAASAIEGLLYDTLVTYDEGTGLVGQLAESHVESDDGLVYRFTLRRGIRFHDGVELVAADVKRSIERALHVDTPCPVPTFYDRIEGYEAFHAGTAKELTGVRATGTYEVEFRLREPDATFLHVLALPIAAPVCRNAGSVYERSFANAPCGAGPFRVTRYAQDDVIVLERHEGYWKKGFPHLDRIEWYLSMQSFTQRFRFEDGSMDYMREFSATDSLLFRQHPEWKKYGEWQESMTNSGFFMNTEMPPFDNRHFRRAVAFAADHAQVALVRPGHVEHHPRVVPEAIQKTTPDMELQRHDLKRAREELALAGYPGGYPDEIPFLALIESFGEQAGQIYQQQLARIGVKIRLQLVGWPTFLAKTGTRRTAAMGTVGWHADFPDPSDFFEPILSTKAIQDEDSQNAAFFSNRELDELLVVARRSTDAPERARLYARAESIVAREAPWSVGYSYRYYEAWQPYVHGYRPHPVLSQAIRGAWLDLDEKQRHVSARRAGRRGPTTTLAAMGAFWR